MFSSLFKKSNTVALPEQIYGSLVTQARSPVFFTDLGFPDSVMGRFDVLSLHVYLFARRMRADGANLSMDLSQEVFDLYVSDVERALRELGIGDTSVPKKKKKMIRSFYGQIDDFDVALDEMSEAVIAEKVVSRYLVESDSDDPQPITQYMIAAEKHLAAQPIKSIMSGDLNWLSPDSAL